MEVLTEREIANEFSDEHLMVLKSKSNNDEPWYVDFVNYIVGKGLDFMGPFPESRGNKYILVAVNYVSKWVEAQALPTNDARVVVKFLRQLFASIDLTLASKSRLLQLNELAKLRDGAYENTRIYKEQTKKWHDSRLRGDKDFKVGDQVLLSNSRLKMYPGKLKSKWSGPNIVKTVYLHGAIEITDNDCKNIMEVTLTKRMMRL
ncbi:reverse transcriptase domain-containing protein [Tanacetum coccineum]